MKEEDKNNLNKSVYSAREENILKFWQENKIFEKTLEGKNKEFCFYDGPPFATGLPHYGHILAGTIKDVIPRYKTMQGFRVPRRWGWDCHGLPVENLVEKELGLKSKKEIEEYGVEKFNKKARESVLKYTKEWREQVPRFGRFVDMDDDYRTMDTSYTESVWWIFSNLFKKGLVYEGFKSMQICPRCETPLSNFEVAQGYKDIKDLSVYAKFEIIGEPNTFFIAWTTTPWTLPGNVALALGEDIDYAKVKVENEYYILAKNRLNTIIGDKEYVLITEMKGSALVGKAYKPIFDYYAKDVNLINRNRGWKTYLASFVTVDSGSGIVHIAPAFGQDDYDLSKKENLPFVQHVSMDGKYKKEVLDFPSDQVKPKDDHSKMDVLIIKNLALRNLLFKKESINHSYPHCWRCETPLLNYATSSWFVNIQKIKNKLNKTNKESTWHPETFRDGRFANLLSNAPDWCISRSRYWGAPIPVWKCTSCDRIKEISSIEELSLNNFKNTNNKYFLMRHGEYSGNTQGVVCADMNCDGLNENGKKQVEESIKIIKNKYKIDLIVYSPIKRAKETALMVGRSLDFKSSQMIEDESLKELGFGVYNRKSINEYHKNFGIDSRDFSLKPEGGESRDELWLRLNNFYKKTEEKYKNKNILVVSHDSPLWLLDAIVEGRDKLSALKIRKDKNVFFRNAEVKEVKNIYVSRNAEGEADLHRPFIDSINLKCECGQKMNRVSGVFDCWFESGSMPYAENHYPFDNKNSFNPEGGLFGKSKRFPADFIGEGVDQTRGWFYSMLVIGTALFGKSPYKNVIVNGMVLAEDGQKMSKSKKNFPDPMEVINKYSMDAIRLFLCNSPVVSAEDVRFVDKDVDIIQKKVLNRYENVLSFYEMYSDKNLKIEEKNALKSKNILDVWIIARLKELEREVRVNLEMFRLDSASRPILDFVDDLSTWYLRRSRDRIKSENKEEVTEALETLKFVLVEFSKIVAPFTPFMADHVYKKIVNNKESVHLEDWTNFNSLTKEEKVVLESMKKTREIVTFALELRTKEKINVRQPLAILSTKENLKESYLELIKDEVNVKEIKLDLSLESLAKLDTTLTVELKEEGFVRDLMRSIQDYRKNKGLKVSDRPTLEIYFEEKKDFINKFVNTIKTSTQLKDLVIKELKIEGDMVEVGYEKAVFNLNNN